MRAFFAACRDLYQGLVLGLARHFNMLRGEQQEPAGINCDIVDIEAGGHAVRRLHHRRRRRKDGEPGAFAHPVDMPVTMQQDRAPGEPPQFADEPIAVDERRADALRQSLRCPRIFEEMVVQRHEPAGFGVFGEGNLHAPHLLSRHHAKGVGEGEMRVGVRVQQDDAETVLRLRRHHHREHHRPKLLHRIRETRLCRICEARDLFQIRLQGFGQGLAEAIFWQDQPRGHGHLARD